MDQQELDDAYDNDVYAFNAKNVLERQRINNEVAMAISASRCESPSHPTSVVHIGTSRSCPFPEVASNQPPALHEHP
jgi:hypothetical protein